MNAKPIEMPGAKATERLDFDGDGEETPEIPAFLRRSSNEAIPLHAADEPSKEIKAPAPTKEEEETIEDLKRREQEIQRKIAEKHAAEKRAVLDQVVTVVKRYEITTEEVVEALGGLKIKRKGVKAKQKYRDPETGVTWSGRGKEPTWIKGKNRKDFLITDATEDDDEE